jgi:hypothetical protein
VIEPFRGHNIPVRIEVQSSMDQAINGGVGRSYSSWRFLSEKSIGDDVRTSKVKRPRPLCFPLSPSQDYLRLLT